MSLPRALQHAAVIAILLGVFFFLARNSVVYGPYGYDEADYMYAASLGLAANYTDTPSLAWSEFIRAGLHRGKDAGRRTELSEMIRASDDVVFYRHWHGPLYTDWLRLAKLFAFSEESMRRWNYIFPVASALLMYFGALSLLSGAAGQVAAILGPVLFLWSFPVIHSSELAPHELFAFCVVAALLALAALMRVPSSNSRKCWYAAVIAAALAFCTLEVAFALIATLMICGHLVRDRLKPDLAFAAKSLAAFVATVLLVWPSALYKLSFVRAYLFMAYLAVFRKGAWGANISVAGTWWLRFVTSPVPWILFALVVVLLVVRRTAWSPVLFPFALYTACMTVAILRVNTETARYVLPLFPAVVLFTAFGVGRLLQQSGVMLRYATVAVVSVAVLLTTNRVVEARHPRRDPQAFALLDAVRQNGLDAKTVLVPQVQVPTLHYYFPRCRIRAYRNPDEISERLQSTPVDAVLYDDGPARWVLSSPAPLRSKAVPTRP